MNEFTRDLIAKLQAEIDERQDLITYLKAKDGRASSAPQPTKAGKPAKTVAAWRKWSPERKRKFKATMAARRKAAKSAAKSVQK